MEGTKTDRGREIRFLSLLSFFLKIIYLAVLGLNCRTGIVSCSIWDLGANAGDGEGQGSLACCCPWGRRESDMTERMDNSNVFIYLAAPGFSCGLPTIGCGV